MADLIINIKVVKPNIRLEDYELDDGSSPTTLDQVASLEQEFYAEKYTLIDLFTQITDEEVTVTVQTSE